MLTQKKSSKKQRKRQELQGRIDERQIKTESWERRGHVPKWREADGAGGHECGHIPSPKSTLHMGGGSGNTLADTPSLCTPWLNLLNHPFIV